MRTLVCAAVLQGCLVATLAGNFAESILSYTPGTGFAKEFGTGLGYTNSAAVLGEPSRFTPGGFGGPVDPFNPAFTRDQLLSLGQNGSLTIRFSTPVLNKPSNPFGIDFLIFGNSGFIITNGNFSGGGITDGSVFGANNGATIVSVSADNSTYYRLNPLLAPIVDGGLFPTDGAGDFTLPVNPSLSSPSFAGKDLAGIRQLYHGSGGGTGFDIDWAQDANGNAVHLDSIQFVRVDVLSGASDIDAFSAVPEPATALLWLAAAPVLLFKFRRCRNSRLRVMQHAGD